MISALVLVSRAATPAATTGGRNHKALVTVPEAGGLKPGHAPSKDSWKGLSLLLAAPALRSLPPPSHRPPAALCPPVMGFRAPTQGVPAWPCNTWVCRDPVSKRGHVLQFGEDVTWGKTLLGPVTSTVPTATLGTHTRPR